MLSKVEIDQNNFITWRETPWDKRVFRRDTFEVMDLCFEQYEDGISLLKAFEFQTDPDLTYTRIRSGDFSKKSVLVKSGFLQCETAFKIQLSNLQAYVSPLRINVLPLADVQKDDFPAIHENIEGMYRYSRFHEDALIERRLADSRMRSWIGDLEEKKVSGLLYKTGANVLVAYMFYDATSNDEVNLILGGAVPGKEMYAPVFWTSLIDHFKRRGHKKVSTTISAINDGVLSLYLGLGFKVSQSLIDFHKHYRCM